LIYPSADTIEDRVGSRYSLVVLAAKRAKQIKEGSPVLIDTLSTNPLTIALEEIAAGKVTIQVAPAIIPGAVESSDSDDSFEDVAAFDAVAAGKSDDEDDAEDESDEAASAEDSTDSEDDTTNEDDEAESGEASL
jgi:DNA-directed RNA polymerase subunit omega